MLWPLLMKLVPGWPMLYGFQLLFPVEFKSLYPTTGSCCGLGGRCESSFPCRIAVAAARCPRSAPGSLRSPVPAEAQGVLPRGQTPPNASLGWEVMFTALSNLGSKQPSPVYQINLPLVGDSDSFVKKIRDKIPSEPGSLRLVLSKRKMFYLLPLYSFCVFFRLLHISWFVVIPCFEASYGRLHVFVYYSGIFMQYLIRLSLKWQTWPVQLYSTPLLSLWKKNPTSVLK